MRFDFEALSPQPGVNPDDWSSWSWQLRNSLKTLEDFQAYFDLTKSELQGFAGLDKVFKVRVPPYYAVLAQKGGGDCPVRKTLMPISRELIKGHQQMLDPLGEYNNRPVSRIIHRYPDRLLLLVTDNCALYCRYCTRKHFTGKDQSMISGREYDQAMSYIYGQKGLREVILSGGDPLSLGDKQLDRILGDLRGMQHLEIIRIGSRMPVVCPMRMTQKLASILKAHKPVFLMTHFNHPIEITKQAADALELFVDNGIPIFNQMVLLNGINNHEYVVQALSRRLLYLRVKPYYMFQCDPSEGTDHLRTSVQDSMRIQKELWGNLSGLAMPNFSLDIPGGGGKVGIVPDFLVERRGNCHEYIGWDGVRSSYISPPEHEIRKPVDAHIYKDEWESAKSFT